MVTTVMDDKHDQVLAGKVFLVIQIHSLRVSAIKTHSYKDYIGLLSDQ